MFTSRWQARFSPALMPLIAALAVTAALFFLAAPPTADAQCGTQMSSCRNCHEVKAQLKVNTKGEWHTSHAFGDFCATCHGGDAKAKDKEPAHAAMAKPLSNVTAACATCHPADMKDRADRFAKILGVTAEMGTGAAAAGAASPSQPVSSAPVVTGTASLGDCGPISGVSVGDIVDFNASAAAPAGPNVGNLILVALILLMAVAWFAIAFFSWIKAARSRLAAWAAPEPATSMPAGVQALVPVLANCDDEILAAIERLVKRGDSATDALVSVSRLSPEWLEALRHADQRELAIALALARKS